MRIVTRFASRSPDHEQGNAIDHSNTLEAPFTIGAPRVFAREEISVKEGVEIDEVDPVFFQIDLALGFVPRDHAPNCICNRIYAATDF